MCEGDFKEINRTLVSTRLFPTFFQGEFHATKLSNDPYHTTVDTKNGLLFRKNRTFFTHFDTMGALLQHTCYLSGRDKVQYKRACGLAEYLVGLFTFLCARSWCIVLLTWCYLPFIGLYGSLIASNRYLALGNIFQVTWQCTQYKTYLTMVVQILCTPNRHWDINVKDVKEKLET